MRVGQKCEDRPAPHWAPFDWIASESLSSKRFLLDGFGPGNRRITETLVGRWLLCDGVLQLAAAEKPSQTTSSRSSEILIHRVELGRYSTFDRQTCEPLKDLR